MVTGGTFITGRCRKYKYLEQELYKLYISQCNNIKELSWRTSQPILVIIPRSFNIRPTCKELSEALERKGNTINKLNLRSVRIIPPSFLTSLTNLKKITIYSIYDSDEDTKEEFQNYLAISEFQILCLNRLSCFKRICNFRMLIKTISNNNCPNIEQLSTYLVPEDFDYVKSLLLNCKNLIYLGLNSLDYFTDMNDENDII
ncbi:hypothetical protein GLOIN_2v1791280 [Rhizophagus irregularis DAOM 181602=DAOM 197198]|uniref:Uncharacterized protein n=1 Tax=Rhizophagus irregularis (strain DAOM 181602 / DAOM 197198 / MUCL 43194) TaxID=747089 RepID=A0A2P4NXC3_RHIID|nr:hypothetical protein GLOIN_2v1791280 [Rhizophagus irregularis DAOM 181602=DAOM 197198]POG57791.1 hypothetical protein GLOIN_2v1791280 [Rhizophagus irregularis DAOM 181602=DAOM 197198]GBC31286.2 hypothetical protein GLOIN_2v1791280 [Rhizophagus irregularis DAOM 181602=DAOM 197198]CAG8711856.1 17191_t:CDS:2 [Rhizophagus irregularis]|eukprot:XP_025164657.1 hypothetical protein GLOIN_2v1791280 [Rhizophagus irregularis DAOM 181602=DAOM 197198]